VLLWAFKFGYSEYSGLVRTLWVDAICIDQGNLTERNNQVRRMKNIYEDAEDVIVWLGPQVDNSDLAMQHLQSIEEFCCNGQGNQVAAVQKMITRSVVSINNEIVFDPQPWIALSFLLNRTWWRRVWTLQEATVPSTVTFKCCRMSIPAETLYTLAKAIASTKLLRPANLPEEIFEIHESGILKLANLTDARRMHTQPKATLDSSLQLLELLTSFRPYTATSMHDRIFAPLGLAIDVPAGQLEMDYSRLSITSC